MNPLPPSLSAIAAAPAGALIALDFDGTLAPIVDDPNRSRPVEGVLATLTTLAGLGAQIAVVTGRAVGTVLELGDLSVVPGIVVSGLHGAEMWREGKLSTREEPDGIGILRSELPDLLPEGVWLEDKRLSLVVHTRQAADPARALAQLTDAVAELASRHGLETHPGKMVLEIRLPELSKATALAELLTPATTAALFAGDDLGDLPAARAVHRWGELTGRPSLTVAVGEVPELREITDHAVDSPAELAELLSALVPAPSGRVAGRG